MHVRIPVCLQCMQMGTSCMHAVRVLHVHLCMHTHMHAQSRSQIHDNDKDNTSRRLAMSPRIGWQGTCIRVSRSAYSPQL